MLNKKLILFMFVIFCGFVLVFLIDAEQGRFFENPGISNNISKINNSVSSEKSIPDNWVSVKPSSSMRFKEFLIKNSKGEFSLIVFKNIGGSADQNISRWIDQFSGPENPLLPFQKNEIEQNGKNFIFLQNSGFFNGGMGQSEAFSDAGLIAFIVDDKSYIYYFKALSSVEILIESKEEIISTILSSSI